MKLLVVEDEARTALTLRRGLSEAGFVVDSCGNGQDGLEMAVTGCYDLVILDVMLPLFDGWSVLAELRRRHNSTPVIMLTAMESIEQRVKGLSLGADDYLVKPFAFEELLARIRSLFRRARPQETINLSFDDIALDPSRQVARREDRVIELTAKEFLLLELLVRNRGEVLSRTVISERVWDMAFDYDSNVVEVNIRRLRAKIDDPFDKKLIHTVRGRGYVLR